MKKLRKKRGAQSRAKVSPKRVPTDEELEAILEKEKWGTSELTTFIDNAHKNIKISYIKLKCYLRLFEDLVETFRKAHEVISCPNIESLVIASFLSRAYGNFLGSVRLAASGQLTESYAQLRVCLENGLYAFYMYQDSSLIQIWENRHKSEKDKKLCRKKFQISEIIKKLKNINSKIGNDAEHLYEVCIDYGAHPNQRALSPNVRVVNDKVRTLIFNDDDGFMRACLSLNTSVGLTALDIFNLIYFKDFEKINIGIRLGNIRSTLRPIAITTAQILRAQRELEEAEEAKEKS